MMSNNISQEYTLGKSHNDAKQINLRVDLNKTQPVILRVIVFILGMIVMALLQLEHSASPLAIGIITLSFIACLQLAVDNWHTKKQLKAVINILSTNDYTVNK
jgi:hypothetical protein